MKKIGILGGMSAASTHIYYRILCDITQQRLGGLHSPNLLLRSVDFAPLAAMMDTGEWRAIAQRLNKEAKILEDAGAEVMVIASNTMHKLAEDIMNSVTIPLIHIADATAQAVDGGGCKSPAFIATKFTIEERFYTDILRQYGLRPILPQHDQRAIINDIIFHELCRNQVTSDSQASYVEIVRELQQAGADSVILGCTEVCLLLNEDNCHMPVFDTTRIHCMAALDAALGSPNRNQLGVQIPHQQ